MQPFPFGTHASLVMLEIVALLVLLGLGLAADAYFSRRKSAPVHAGAYYRPAARPTLAGWHRAAWRRANREAAQTKWLWAVEMETGPKLEAGVDPYGSTLSPTTQGSKSSALEFKPGVPRSF